LKPGGRVWVATDDPHYATQIQSVFPAERWTYEPGRSLYPTYFEMKWKNLGRSIHYFCFMKEK
jgi:tRNA G46 methylase TrmB